MAEPIDSSLFYEVLKDVQARRRARLEGMRAEKQEGFGSLRAHMATQHGDAVFLEPAGCSNSSATSSG
jgi:hypothetical protein